MTREEIIQGLQFTIDMFLFDPLTGEVLKEPRNEDDKITVDACKGAIAALKAEPCEVTWVTNNKGEGIAFKDMPIEKVNKILAIMDDEPCDTLKLDGMLEDAYEHGYEQAKYDYEVQLCEDAVSREAVLDLVVANRTELSWTNVIMYSPFYKGIIQLPSVTPKQRTGKWIYTNEYTGISVFYICSKCGRKIEVFDDKNIITNFPYCHCGAKMEGESE